MVAFFRWFCKSQFLEELEGDLTERYYFNIDKYGNKKANLLFTKEVLSLLRPNLIRNIQFNHLKNKIMITNHKRLFTFIFIALGLLSVPLVAMQFTNEVNWNVADFLVMGILLFSTAFFCDLVLKKIKTKKYRLIFLLIVLLIFFLIWAELAVGLFGSPFAGS